VFFFLKEKNTGKRLVFLYALFCIANTVLDIAFRYYFHAEQLLEINQILYTPVEFIIFSLIFLQIFTTSINRNIVLTGIFVFLVSWLLLYVTVQQENFDSIAVALEEILLIAYSIRYYFERISKIDSIFLYATPEFWIVAAILIYSAATFFVYLYADSYMGTVDFKKQYDIIHLIASILKNLLLTVALLTQSKKNLPNPFQQNLT
jgi:hypothetical protein